MPKIRGAPSSIDRPARDSLVGQLVEELKNGGGPGGPVIFEIPIQGTDTYHIIVVWERWELSPEDRSSIILEAYERYDEAVGAEQAMSPKITLVISVTPDEAVGNNLLPYFLSPCPRLDPDGLHYDKIRKAMREAGAIETSSGSRLSFPTKPMRAEAEKELVSKTREIDPGIQWVRGEFTASSWNDED
jgi:hypothetical protein